MSVKVTLVSSEHEPAAGALIDYLNNPSYRPMAQRELLQRMQVATKLRPAVRRLIRRLIQQGKIQRIRGGRLVVAPARGTLRDELHRRVLGEEREVVIGVYRERGRAGEVLPFDRGLADAIHIPAAFRRGAADLQAVRVERERRAGATRAAGPATGKVLEVLGHLDDPATEALVVAHKYGLATAFPQEVLLEASRLPVKVSQKDLATRERFATPPVVTIDGENARDFDDAIAVEELQQGGGFRLYVHIADVAHYVQASSTLDNEARRRGTSVYFPDRVLPMFPERLSNDLCSLVPGKDRLVQSVIMDFSAAGKRRRVRFADGVIHSAARLTYTEVAEVLDGSQRHSSVPADLRRMLSTARRLGQLLERQRHGRGSIDFDLPESQLLFDTEGVMTGVELQPRNAAHDLIEEFMLAANEAVADHLERHDASCLFRVHEQPDPAKLEALGKFIESFGLALPAGDRSLRAEDIQGLLQQAAKLPQSRVISQMTLRAMKQAHYSVQNIGHFGLASPAYCHFTSPIRRYPDLEVHRLLRACRSRGAAAGEAEQDQGLQALAQSCSELERNAESAERELLVWKKVAFIAGKVGQTFDAVVTGVTRFGLFVQLNDSLVEGLLRVERLGAERFDFVESRQELRAQRSSRSFRLGDQLRVEILRVDRVLQRVDLSLAVAKRSARNKKVPAKRQGPTRRKPLRKRRRV